MADFQHILFPLDFSPQVNLAVPYVVAFARRLNAKVTLISAVPPIWAGRGPKPEYASELELTTKQRLERVLTAELQGLTVDRVVRSGDPAEQILRFAQEHGVDLIMMPTHGYGTFRSLLIGSVTAKVLHDAHCPVWTAAHAAEQRARDVPRTMICAVDGTPKSAELMRWAAGFSGRFGAALQLLHVVPPITDWAAWEADRQLQEAERKAAHARIESLRKQAGVDAPVRVAVGPIAPTVAERAHQEEADLVIIGRGQIGAPLGRLRTHAYAIIQRSPCPVLSV